MTRISFKVDLSDLIDDMKTIKAETKPRLQKIVDSSAREGNKLARDLARQRSGPHGQNYYKRISAERVAPLTNEYGPEGIPKSDFIGAGFRHGRNHDLPNSADVIGPRMARDVGKLAADLFWPGAK